AAALHRHLPQLHHQLRPGPRRGSGLGRAPRCAMGAGPLGGHGDPFEQPDPAGPPDRTMSDPRLFIDADACPVKDEVYRVAARYGLHVFVVSNAFVNTPRESWIE